jgi:PST family polysaccharide transporter
VTVEVNNPADELLPAEQKPAVGNVAARGLLWMFGQSTASKLITTASQIVLGWLLFERDFGRIGLALTVYSFPALLQQAGLRDVLTQRQERFAKLANPAFWMGLCSGILAALIMVAAAPIAQRAYQKEIVGLVMLLALSSPFEGLATVPYAKLQIEMRFRAIALITLWNIAATAALSIFFAWRHYGPYSVILPRPILAAVQAVVLFWWTRPRLRLAPQLEYWRELLAPLGLLFAVNVCNTLVSQADYMALGYFRREQVVGLYFFAFGLSLQGLRLVASSVSSVVFPALSRFQDNPQHQVQVSLKMIRVMACIATPLMLLQALLARPAMNIVFRHKWDAAVPIVQILTIGFSLDALNWIAGSLLQAQGRFGRYLAINIALALTFLTVVTIAASRYEALGVAIGVAIYYLAMSPVFLSLTLRPLGVGIAQIAAIYVRPLLIALTTFAAAGLAARGIPDIPGADWLRALAILIVGGAVYIPLLIYVTPDAWLELRTRAVQILNRGGFRRGFPVNPA